MTTLRRGGVLREASIALIVCLAVGLSAHPLIGGASGSPAGTDARTKPLEMILVGDQESGLILATAPVAAKVKESGRTPILLALSSQPTKDEKQTLTHLLPSCNSCTVISVNQILELPDLAENPIRKEKIKGSTLLDTTLLLARKYWQRVETVVLCQTSDPELSILGATMAGRMKVPILVCEDEADLARLPVIVQEMGVSNVLVAGKSPSLGTLSETCKIEQLGTTSIVSRTVGLIGVDNVRNVVLARTPDGGDREGNASWLAPYLSVMRRAPVVLCSSDAPTEAEEKVAGLIDKHALRPRTITILADHDSIGGLTVADPDLLAEYEVGIEPCSGSLDGSAASFGVGRIPFRDIADASRMIAGSLAREAILTEQPTRVVVIGNPQTVYSSLPLAEVVTRITAEEFKNFDIDLTEFYDQGSSTREVVDAATKAQFIVYEGHITDQLLFRDPCEVYEYYYEEETEMYSSHEPIEGVSENPLAWEQEPDVQEVYGYARPPDGSDPAADGEREDDSLTDAEKRPPYTPLEQLAGLPVVVLQSCHSLEEPTNRRILDLGGVGLVGSTTNVYSASGSAFVKAFCDGLLYRNQTVGEALRDARNYFLCLAALKKQLGHKETAKAYRAALSFGFWGDPEIRLFPSSLRAGKEPVMATFTDPHTVKISTPRYRLPEAKNEKYLVRMFPGSQVAGIVKKLKNKPIRRLTPFYFFRLEAPAGFDADGYRRLEYNESASERSVFLEDPLKRFVYILYFPEKEAKSKTSFLRFVE
jgi:hypothetical protein